jgi:hypothetical protein
VSDEITQAIHVRCHPCAAAFALIANVTIIPVRVVLTQRTRCRLSE